jgi:phosphate starvation-inducible PhoH-like protein
MSGLRHALLVLRGVSGVSFNHFDAADVVRHPLVQRIVQAYESQAPTNAVDDGRDDDRTDARPRGRPHDP